MIRALFIIGIGLYGYYLTNLWHPLYSPSTDKDARFWQYVGFAMIAFAIWRWRLVWEGLQSAGKLAVFVLLVALLAAVWGGQTDLLAEIFQ